MTKACSMRAALLAIAAAALILTAATGTARAGKEERDEALRYLTSAMYNAINFTKLEGWGSDEVGKRREDCRGALVEAKAEGIRDRDDIEDSSFAVHPKAKKVGDSYVVKFADLGWFCDELETRLNYFDLIQQLSHGLYVQGRISGGLSDEEKRTVTGEQVATVYDNGKRCSTALTKELERGLDPDKALELTEGRKLKPSAAGEVCAAYKTYGDQLDEVWQVKFTELAAKYRAVGIKGDRLDLFVYYDQVEFYLKGCKSSTSDPKKLKKAKALFQWLTDSNDLITIRKFAFKGDTYKITEAQYVTEKAAYKGCK